MVRDWSGSHQTRPVFRQLNPLRGSWDRVWVGIKAWLPVAHSFTAVAVVLTLFTGGTILEKYGKGMGLVEVVVVYYLGAILAGAIFGGLAPLKRTVLGAAFVGVVAMLPVGLMIIPLVAPPGMRVSFVVACAVVFALVLGPGYGLIDRHFDEHED